MGSRLKSAREGQKPVCLAACRVALQGLMASSIRNMMSSFSNRISHSAFSAWTLQQMHSARHSAAPGAKMRSGVTRLDLGGFCLSSVRRTL